MTTIIVVLRLQLEVREDLDSDEEDDVTVSPSQSAEDMPRPYREALKRWLEELDR
jgi:hypothetical protein